MENDIILNRAGKGLCPICKCKLEKDSPRMDIEYKDTLIQICLKHHRS